MEAILLARLSLQEACDATLRMPSQLSSPPSLFPLSVPIALVYANGAVSDPCRMCVFWVSGLGMLLGRGGGGGGEGGGRGRGGGGKEGGEQGVGGGRGTACRESDKVSASRIAHTCRRIQKVQPPNSTLYYFGVILHTLNLLVSSFQGSG